MAVFFRTGRSRSVLIIGSYSAIGIDGAGRLGGRGGLFGGQSGVLVWWNYPGGGFGERYWLRVGLFGTVQDVFYFPTQIDQDFGGGFSVAGDLEERVECNEDASSC